MFVLRRVYIENVVLSVYEYVVYGYELLGCVSVLVDML